MGWRVGAPRLPSRPPETGALIQPSAFRWMGREIARRARTAEAAPAGNAWPRRKRRGLRSMSSDSKRQRTYRRAAPARTICLQPVQRLLEAVGVRALGLRQRLEPVRDFGEAFFARGLRHARVHV